MKILLLTENWRPKIGGIESYLAGLTNALRKQGDAVEIIEPSKRRFFWPLVKPAWLPLFFYLYRRAKLEKYDAVLCGKALFEGHVGYYLKKYFGIPYIIFTYAMEIEVWRKVPKQARALKRVLGKADLVAYINDVTKQALLEFGVDEQKLLKLLPGVASGALASVSPATGGEIGEKYELPGRYILSVGRLIQRKGFDVLLEAFSELDQTRFGEVQLLIVGEGPEQVNLKNLAEKLWINKSVRFLGSVPAAALPALYDGAEVFALTPRNINGDFEGFGIVYLEAAARGVPAIGTKTGGVAEAVIDEQTGLLVEPDDHVALRDTLTRLLGDDALSERLGVAARQRVEREFLWEQRAQDLRLALLELVT